jgi:hypothetical protein
VGDRKLDFPLTRAQRAALKRLRDEGQIWVTRMRRENVDALVIAGLAYETDSGWLIYALPTPDSGAPK